MSPKSFFGMLPLRNRILSSLAVAVLTLLGALQAASSAAQDGSERLWVEVRDAKGKVPADLSPADLQVAEPGGEIGVSLAASSTRGQWVIYIDRVLSGRGAVRRATEALAAASEDLVATGEVTVVTADEQGGPSLDVRSDDALVVSERLARMGFADLGLRRLHSIRERTLQEWRRSGLARPAIEENVRIEGLLRGVEEEFELVQNRLRRMVLWATQTPATTEGPRVLVPVLDGFDLDPVSFYVQHLEEQPARRLLRQSPRFLGLDAEVRQLAQALGGAGWTVMPVAMLLSQQDRAAAEFSILDNSGDDESRRTLPGADQSNPVPGITIRPGQLFGRKTDDDAEESASPIVELRAPLEPLKIFAQASGGEVLTNDQALRDAVERFSERVEISYPSRLGYHDGLQQIEVRTTRPGWTVRAPRWRIRGVPEALSGLRSARLLAGIEVGGDLAVAAVLEVPGDDEGDESEPLATSLEARLDLHDLDGQREDWSSTTLRLTIESKGPTGEQRLHQEILTGQDLSDSREWRIRRDVALPRDASVVAVVIEDLDRGLWGGRRAAVVRATDDVAGSYLPSPAVLEIQQPEANLLRGRVRFEVDAFDPQTSRVKFLLDDREVAVSSEAPFSARLDLGRTPRRQTLTVVAYDAESRELGRDSAVLNGGDAGLAVEITSPTTRRVSGTVEVAADVAVPLERKLDRVLFFWNNETVATLYSEPFRQPIVIPEDRPVGYVRVVAMLDDGTLAEDVLFLNGPDASERLDINLVELYVVVTNDDGRPVRGLTQADFSIREEGVKQNIATFSDAAEIPLTLGMAIDSSASMFVKLPRVQKAAGDFLRSAFKPQDRAFVVDFDSQPRLARGTTNDLDRVVQSINSLEPSGRTALWESVVYSLVQMQGVRGRKALVVFSDGADEDDRFPFRTSMRIAKEMGVPIYMILMRKKPEDSPTLGLLSRSFISRAGRLSKATGGRVFYAKEYDDLSEVYDEIEAELRSQYLLTYYPNTKNSRAGWRDVDVDLQRRGMKPRTQSGYWQ